MKLIRNVALALALVIATLAGVSAATENTVTAHAAPMSPQVVRQFEGALTGGRLWLNTMAGETDSAIQQAGRAVGGIRFNNQVARVCVRHPRGEEAIPLVGRAITYQQCWPHESA